MISSSASISTSSFSASSTAPYYSPGTISNLKHLIKLPFIKKLVEKLVKIILSMGATTTGPVEPAFFKEIFDEALEVIDFLREGVKGSEHHLKQREAAALLSCIGDSINALLEPHALAAGETGRNRDALLALGGNRHAQHLAMAWKRFIIGIEVLVVALWDYP